MTIQLPSELLSLCLEFACEDCRDFLQLSRLSPRINVPTVVSTKRIFDFQVQAPEIPRGVTIELKSEFDRSTFAHPHS